MVGRGGGLGLGICCRYYMFVYVVVHIGWFGCRVDGFMRLVTATAWRTSGPFSLSESAFLIYASLGALFLLRLPSPLPCQTDVYYLNSDVRSLELTFVPGVRTSPPSRLDTHLASHLP